MAIITISGNLGAGKTTLANSLVSALGYEEFHIGKIFRQLASERGLTIEAFYDELQKNPELEKSIDGREAEVMRAHDNLVVQGRIAWFFAKQSPFPFFNIFLAVTPEVGATRAAELPENAEKSNATVAASNAHRALLEVERYKNLYGIENFLDPKHYDLVLDTTHLTREEVLNTILTKLRDKKIITSV